MKKLSVLTLVAVMFALLPLTAGAASSKSIMPYGSVSLTGGNRTGNFHEVWDLTNSCGLTIEATVDMTGMVDRSGAHAWAQLGVRAVGAGNFNPAAGNGIWLGTDYHTVAGTFGPDPSTGPVLDLDDKLILQKVGGNAEADYNLPSTPSFPGINSGVWFDRDGVAPSQATLAGAFDGKTYNTRGLYHVLITLAGTNGTGGTAYMTVNGVQQGFYDGTWHDGQPAVYPAGMTWSGDMTQQQVFYGLSGKAGSHTVIFKDITVTGCVASK